MGDAEIDHLRVPATNFCSSCSNLIGLFYGPSMFLPLNPLSCSCACHRIDLEATRKQCSTIRLLRTHAPFRSLTFLPTVVTESN